MVLTILHVLAAATTSAPSDPSVAPAQLREKINFDFAWRHWLGTATGRPQDASYDDSAWQLIDAPHDMLMGQRRQFTSPKDQGYIDRGSGWYRKHFSLPAEWRGSGGVWVYIEGAFHVTTAWLNGAPLGAAHQAGYTSFYLPLHTASTAKWGGANVLALHVNASSGTGWWYEGGGLVRHNYLVRTPARVYIEPDSAWAHIALAPTPRIVGTSPSGLRSDAAATVAVQAAIRSDAAASAAASAVSLHIVVYDASGKKVSPPPSGPPPPPVALPAGSSVTLNATVELAGGAELWSITRPYLYTVALSVVVVAASGGGDDGVVVAASGGGGDGVPASSSSTTSKVVDAVNVSVGARTVAFDADRGFILNGEGVKMRGFCDHSNLWRMAHNPPVPSRLDLMDALGVLAMDENRDFGGHQGQGGVTAETIAEELDDTRAMVRRDRNHPSIVLWSLCNEVGCRNESPAAAFREAIRALDTTRPITQNHLGVGAHPLSTASLDVQGFSHQRADVFERFHVANPHVPMLASECCSCLSQRGEDTDWCPHPRPTDGCSSDACQHWCGGRTGSNASAGQFFTNEISQCTAEQVAISDGAADIAGTFVWSGFDYLGESRGWPQIAKPRGTIADAAGFPKESFYWLRQWWLSRIDPSDAGRPPLRHTKGPGGATGSAAHHTAFIVDAWRPRARADGTSMPHTRTVHVYTDAPYVRMELNGQAVAAGKRGGLIATPAYGNAEVRIDYAPGNLTAVALAHDGVRVLATHTRLTSGAPASIRLSLDAPSPHTGTGGALVADGEDVALVRAEVLDRHGRLCDTDVATELTFSVGAGAEAILWATANGDPADTSRDSPYSPTRQVYYGLARAVIRSASDRTSPPAARRRMRAIDLEGGRWRADGGGVVVADPEEDDVDAEQKGAAKAAKAAAAAAAPLALAPVVVTAVAKGLQSGRLEIPLSRDPADLPLAVARRSVDVAWRG